MTTSNDILLALEKANRREMSRDEQKELLQKSGIINEKGDISQKYKEVFYLKNKPQK